jgi:hypothetical protein
MSLPLLPSSAPTKLTLGARNRSATIRSLLPLCRTRPSPCIPALRLGPFGQLLWLEGYVHRRQQLDGAEPAEAGLPR